MRNYTSIGFSEKVWLFPFHLSILVRNDMVITESNDRRDTFSGNNVTVTHGVYDIYISKFTRRLVHSQSFEGGIGVIVSS